VFRVAKRCHQDFRLLRTIILVIHHHVLSPKHECIWKSLDYTQESRFIRYKFKGQTVKSHTPRSMQRMEAELDKHKRVVTMFQHVAKHSV
jgi:hypothetical protein